MKKLVRFFLTVFTAVSLFYVIIFYQQANPPIIVLVISFMIQFFAIGFLFGNLICGHLFDYVALSSIQMNFEDTCLLIDCKPSPSCKILEMTIGYFYFAFQTP